MTMMTADLTRLRSIPEPARLKAALATKRRAAVLEPYRYDPAAFVRDCFVWRADEGPTAYQAEILSELVAQRRISVRGPHGLGKTTLMAWIVLWFALTRDGEDWKAITTASAWRQLTKFLWPEIRKWARRLNWRALGREPFNERTELLSLSLKLTTGEAFAVASDNAALIEGAHADCLLYVYDESKSIPDATFDAAEGAFAGAGGDTGNEAYAIAVSTPGEPHGRFYDIQARKPGYEDWWVRHVTLDETIAAGRVSREWAEQRARQWGGEASAIWQNRVAGNFATSDEDGVIPLAYIERAHERWREWDDAGRPGRFVAVGVDVARFGRDKTTMALRYIIGDLQAIEPLRYTSREDTTQTAGRVMGILGKLHGKAVIDVIGIGGGVVDQVRAAGHKVIGFNAGARTDRHDRSGELGFADTRSAAWWNMREMLEAGDVALPPDDILTGDLTAPKWRVVSGGRIKVEEKDELKKATRLGRSTDAADAVIQSLWDGDEPRQARAF